MADEVVPMIEPSTAVTVGIAGPLAADHDEHHVAGSYRVVDLVVERRPGRKRSHVLEHVPLAEPGPERVGETTGAATGVVASVADEHVHCTIHAHIGRLRYPSHGDGATTTVRRMLEDTIEALRAAALEADDAAGYFPAMYARVTERIDLAAADGRFGDGVGMVDFARAFAGWYLRPRSGVEPIPGAWRAAWDVSDDRRLLIVQHLLLGINAHVNHDLPQVVIDVADERGDLAGIRTDFDAVNDVLAGTLPEVLHDLGRASRWVNLAAGAGGGRLFTFSLTAARDQAWRYATRCWPLEQADRAREAVELDEMVRVLAYLVARPAWPVRWIVPIARRLEEDDPRRVVRDLLGDLA